MNAPEYLEIIPQTAQNFAEYLHSAFEHGWNNGNHVTTETEAKILLDSVHKDGRYYLLFFIALRVTYNRSCLQRKYWQMVLQNVQD